MSDIHNELLYARILWIGVIWIKIITAIDDAHVRLFFEVATINFTVFVIERSYRILIARYPKGDFIAAVVAFNIAVVPVFNFFSHSIFATIIHIGFKIKILFVYSGYFPSDRNG